MTLELDLGLEQLTEKHPAQWRLRRIEVVNWGTFDKHHVAEVGRTGHLITGASGSGKSSLLDAIATVLTPRKWLRFNAAAQDSTSRVDDRSLVSYVRGAWRRQTDEETGDTVSRYLRPGATWSGILLRFENAVDEPVNLVRLFHLKRGTNAVADLAELHVLRRGAASLLDFAEFARAGLDKRRLDAAFDGVYSTKDHSPFSARFRRLLGIGNDSALQLLHKTQSAKNLGSLDALFRGFMLDEPATFGLAKTAVDQFDELSRAHRLVVEAREQVDILRRMQEPAERYERSVIAGFEADRLSEAIDDYVELRMHGLARRDRDESRESLAAREGDLAGATDAHVAARAELKAAQQNVLELGGAALESLRVQLTSAQEQYARVERERRRWFGRLRDVGVSAPGSAEEFQQLRTTAERERRELGDATASAARTLEQLNDARTRARERRDEIDAELAELKHRRSNIPRALLAARTAIVAETNLPESAFPFAGELIDVAPEHAEWTGAIERVLRPLATVLLVRDDHLADITHIIDRLHLGTRLVYESVGTGVQDPRPARTGRSLINRVRVTDAPMAPWIRRRLSEQFDYECVEDARQLRSAEQGVTRAGQVKRSARRFEKDDRFRVDDRHNWVLGSDNGAKVDLLLAERGRAVSELDAAVAAIRSADVQRAAAQRRIDVLTDLDSTDWAELDLDAAEAAIELRREQYERMSDGNTELGSAQRLERDATAREEETALARRAAASVVDALQRTVLALDEQIDRLAARQSEWTIDDDALAALDDRFHTHVRSLSRDTLDATATKVTKQLAGERLNADNAANASARAFEAFANEFIGRWRATASELTATISDRSGFAELHGRIVSTGLPEYEGRFFELLKSQSQQLTGQLLSVIRGSQQEIKSRIDPVNASLLRSPFDEGRFLQILVKDRRSPEVKDFMEKLQTISAGSWGEEDREAAERRFDVLRSVMVQLGSEEHAAWKRRVLDTREHVTFVGIEQDAKGTEMNRHESGAGLSGGQKQKLVIFCLAAALRYQLAQDEDDVPAYGTIILDEAFDKADSTFTRMAMDVFLEFGFHMILATPLKLLQTLEVYVDGVSYVSCRDHNDSRISAVPIEVEAA